jgi:serine/threonine protein kinase
MQNQSANSNLYYQVEIAFFEALEQVAHLTLGELTKIRRKSRAIHRDLIQVAVMDNLISLEIASRIYQQLSSVLPIEMVDTFQQEHPSINLKKHLEENSNDILLEDQPTRNIKPSGIFQNLKTPETLPTYQTPVATPSQNRSPIPFEPLAIDQTPLVAQVHVFNQLEEGQGNIDQGDIDQGDVDQGDVDEFKEGSELAEETLEFEDQDFDGADLAYLPLKLAQDCLIDLDGKLLIYPCKNTCLSKNYESILLDASATPQELRAFKEGHYCLSLFDKSYFPKIYDFGVFSDHRYLANLEQIEGICLVEYLKAKDLSWQKRVWLIWQLCYVMAHIHQKNIVFFNLNPKMIEICNFGIRLRAWQLAHRVDKLPIELPLSLLHDAHFSAPEVLNQGDFDLHSDVFSLASMIYWLYTGQNVPRDPKVREIAFERIREMPQHLKNLCLKSLSDQAQQRPKNAILFYQACFGENLFDLQQKDAFFNANTAFTSDHTTTILSKELEYLSLQYEAGFSPSLYQPLYQHLPWMNLFSLGIGPEAYLEIPKLFLESNQVKIRKCAPYHEENQVVKQSLLTLTEGIYELSWHHQGSEHHTQMLLTANQTHYYKPFADWLFERHCPLQKSLVSVGAYQPISREMGLHLIEISSCAPWQKKCTNAEYLLFLQSLSLGDQYIHLPLNWEVTDHGIMYPQTGDMAVSGISLIDAQSYCLWISEQENQKVELMSEAVWERLARGAGCEEWIGSGEYDVLDLEEGMCELCVLSGDWALLKGGRLSKGRVAWRKIIRTTEKIEGAGFRACLNLA